MRKTVKQNFVLSVLILLGCTPVFASASTQLIGSVTDNCSASVSENYVVATQFTASQTGTMNVFRLRVENNASAEVAVYSDVANVPTTLLDSMSGVSVVTGWNDITFDNLSLTSGTKYWLAANTGNGDANDTCYSTGGTSGYFARTYGTGFPATFPAYSSANWDVKYQGWATTTDSGSTGLVEQLDNFATTTANAINIQTLVQAIFFLILSVYLTALAVYRLIYV